jgi:hypothetical protein
MPRGWAILMLLAAAPWPSADAQAIREPVRVELADPPCAPGVCRCRGRIEAAGALVAHGVDARALERGVRCVAADLDGDGTTDFALHGGEGLAVIVRSPGGGAQEAVVIDAGGVIEPYAPRAAAGPHGEPAAAIHGLLVRWVGQHHAIFLWDGRQFVRTLLPAWPP